MHRVSSVPTWVADTLCHYIMTLDSWVLLILESIPDVGRGLMVTMVRLGCVMLCVRRIRAIEELCCLESRSTGIYLKIILCTLIELRESTERILIQRETVALEEFVV